MKPGLQSFILATLGMLMQILPGFSQELVPLGQWEYGAMSDVEFWESYAYCGSGNYLITLDISDPQEPVQTGTIHYSSFVGDIVQLEDNLYVGLENTLYVYHIESDGSLMQLQTLEPGKRGYIEIGFNEEYILMSLYHLTQIYHRGSDGTLTLNAELTGYEKFEQTAYFGNYIYGVFGGNEMYVLDLSDGTEPVLTALVPPGGKGAYGIAVANGNLFLGGGDSTFIFDLINPESPHIIGRMPGFALGIAVYDDRVYLAAQGNQTKVFDIQEIGHPVYIKKIPINSENVKTHGDLLVIITQYSGFYLFALQTDHYLDELTFVQYGGSVSDLAVDGHYAYISYYLSGLTMLSLDFPLIEKVGNFQHTELGTFYAIALNGNTLYLGHDGGLSILDVTNPHMPMLLETISYSSNVEDLYLDGTTLFVAAYNSLKLLDVTNPTDPELIGELPVDYDGLRLVYPIDENVVYIYTRKNFLKSIDISDPSAPQIVDSMAIGQYFYDLVRYGDYVYLGSTASVILDVSDPLHPEVVSHEFYFSYSPLSFAVYQNYLFVAFQWEEAQTFGMDDPLNPVNLNIKTPTSNSAIIKLREDTLYVLDYFNGLSAYRFSESSTGIHWMSGTSTPLRISPNPAQSEIRIQIPEHLNYSSCRLTILTADGRWIKDLTLVEGNAWIATPVDQLAPGTYLIQLSDGHRSYSGRFVKF